jgi:sulfur relay (sulfurtransferase) complex TusBCD TusD component (DsrE family)
MNTLLIVNHPPYGTEHAFNALRLADWTVAADKILVF